MTKMKAGELYVTRYGNYYMYKGTVNVDDVTLYIFSDVNPIPETELSHYRFKLVTNRMFLNELNQKLADELYRKECEIVREKYRKAMDELRIKHGREH